MLHFVIVMTWSFSYPSHAFLAQIRKLNVSFHCFIVVQNSKDNVTQQQARDKTTLQIPVEPPCLWWYGIEVSCSDIIIVIITQETCIQMCAILCRHRRQCCWIECCRRRGRTTANCSPDIMQWKTIERAPGIALTLVRTKISQPLVHTLISDGICNQIELFSWQQIEKPQHPKKVLLIYQSHSHVHPHKDHNFLIQIPWPSSSHLLFF